MVGARNHVEGRIGQKLGNLLHRPAWTNILVAIQKEPRPLHVCDLLQQRWALDIRLPGAVDLRIHLHVWRIVERRKYLQALVASLAVDAMPLPIIVHTPTRDTDEAQHALR